MAGYACTTGASSFVGFVLLSIPICYIYLLGTLPRRVTDGEPPRGVSHGVSRSQLYVASYPAREVKPRAPA